MVIYVLDGFNFFVFFGGFVLHEIGELAMFVEQFIPLLVAFALFVAKVAIGESCLLHSC